MEEGGSFSGTSPAPSASVGLEIFYSQFAEGTSVPLDDVSARLPDFSGQAGYEPMPTLMSITVPSLWQFGELDRSIPTRLDVENMARLQAAGLPVEFIVHPFANHGLIDARTGQRVDLWSDYLDWMRGRGILPVQ